MGDSIWRLRWYLKVGRCHCRLNKSGNSPQSLSNRVIVILLANNLNKEGPRYFCHHYHCLENEKLRRTREQSTTGKHVRSMQAWHWAGFSRRTPHLCVSCILSIDHNLFTMRLITLVVLLALCLGNSNAFYNSGSLVISLSPSTFDKAIKGSIHLVEFYAPWW
jgi:hypothetical protein